MLTEIYCEAFGTEKHIPFTLGLNIIQGRGGNSIGKSTVLKIIDYAFGGKYYSDSNDDVIKHVGDHEICFAHTFEGITFYFKRNAKHGDKVAWCEDNTYTAVKETTTDEFCDWLLNKYPFQSRAMTFRDLVGLYCRIWNKPNKEVNRPLYKHSSQNISDSIMSLIKLFDKYAPLQELDEHRKYLKKHKAILNSASRFHVINLPNAADYKKFKKEIAEISTKISVLEGVISSASADNYVQLDDNSAALFERRSYLSRQHNHIVRELKRIESNISQLCPIESETFCSLQEFFPNINIERLEEVQVFHTSLQKILRAELEEERSNLLQQLQDIEAEINSNEKAVQELTGLPTQAAKAIDELQSLIRKHEQLKKQIELFEDKRSDLEQEKAIEVTLEKLMSEITTEIQTSINLKIKEFSHAITSGNSKAPTLSLATNHYSYGVEDNTGTGKAYTDLVLFDLAILSLTDLPILIHDSFLFNNIDDETKRSFLILYSKFTNKQVFISLDDFLGNGNEVIDKISFSSTRLYLSEKAMLFGKDWRKEPSVVR